MPGKYTRRRGLQNTNCHKILQDRGLRSDGPVSTGPVHTSTWTRNTRSVLITEEDISSTLGDVHWQSCVPAPCRSDQPAMQDTKYHGASFVQRESDHFGRLDF